MSAHARARKRLRVVTAMLAAAGVIGFGIVPATAAYALGAVTARVVDTSGNP